MIKPIIHANRRAELTERIGGPILLMGHTTRRRNLPMNELPFRQDSSFLYLTGCERPGCALLLVDGRATLFAPEPAEDDALWHGHVESLGALRARYGVDAVRPSSALEEACKPLAGDLRTVAVADDGATARAAALTGLSLRYAADNGSDDLIDALIELRRVKRAEEVAEHRAAAEATAAAFALAMASTRPGGHERAIAALFDAALAARGCTNGYPSIVTVHGEVLHNFHYTNALKDGDLLLLDGGAERPSGYGVDVTRTWPVTGRFTPRQRAAYEAVLTAQRVAIGMCRAGVRYRDVHLTAARVLARWLKDEGLVTCEVETAVDAGAHALFFPHGVGHLLGMDVHDLENFGDRAAYAPGRERADQFGLSYLRMDMDLEPGFLVTIEPGFYAVPAILDDAGFRERFKGMVDFERAASWVGLGGIRIEDDVLVTEGAPEVLTSAIPKETGAVEAAVGFGPGALARLTAIPSRS